MHVITTHTKFLYISKPRCNRSSFRTYAEALFFWFQTPRLATSSSDISLLTILAEGR